MLNFLKGNKLYSILLGKCPVCHESDMYETPNPYNLNQTLKMHERCSNCNTKYKIEPSFFYGAMYVSYGLGIAFAVAAFIITHYIIGASLTSGFIAIVATLILVFPIIMRLSRNIWINLFMTYDPSKALKKN